ncbi:T9SS type A sorting domain-containing protein [Aequorivita marina]|uniref:T9SS type A sorting domain-containing protein n=1 Tax=Aequorivita marina TaxID=3073654 RepID=UPI0028754E1C|nr:T9SS type A sorting domain-containing protein [Aequorivita sp. S2608]MDS1298166.1 T9SS type A sorting domain-containing protein [Aequorivita sp. S2608]
MRLKLLLLFALCFVAFEGQSQSREYIQMIDAGTYKVQDIIDTAEAYFEEKDKGRGSGYKQFKRWEYNALRLVEADGYLPTTDERLNELERWNAHLNSTAQNRAALSDNWEELGPELWSATSGWNPGVGRLTGISIEEGNPDHMIVGANTGGVWKTTDGTQTWVPLNDYFSNLSVYSVTIHPTDPDTYFFGSTNGKMFKSTDAGATWDLLGTIGNSVVNKILVNPSNVNMIFATSQNSGIYRSTDAGATWAKINSDPRGYDIEFKPDDLSVVYASGSGFHKSNDGGNTFTTVTGFSNGPKMIGVSEDDPNVVYVLEASNGRFGGFYSSDDAGDNFTKLNHAGKNYFGYSTSANDNRGQAPRDMAIAVNPTDVNEVHIAGILSWRSMDGGANFTATSDWTPSNAASQNLGYCHADVDDLMFFGTTLYAVTDGGVFRAADTGNITTNYYEDLTEGLGIRQFYKIGVSQTSDVIISGGSQDNGTSFYTEATGWRDWLGADGMESFIDKSNTNIFYGTSQYGTLYRSMNGGSSYINMNSPGGGSGNWVTPFEQDPVLENTIYVGYNNVYKSTNFGGSWTSISQSLGGNIDNLKIAPSNNQIMYATRGRSIFKTDDSGATDWEQLPRPGGSINSIAIHPTNPNLVAVAVNAGNRVMVSEDGGQTWISYKKNLPSFSSLALIWDDNGKNGLYLGMDYGIFYIDDTFSEWQPYNNLLPNVMINEFEINNTTNTLYAATYGRGLWASPLVEATVGIDEVVSENSVSIYPNPATSEITIAMPKSVNAEIRIFDISGKLLVFEAQTLVNSKHKVNVSSLTPGAYFVRINSEEGTATKKLLIN